MLAKKKNKQKKQSKASQNSHCLKSAFPNLTKGIDLDQLKSYENRSYEGIWKIDFQLSSFGSLAG